MDSRLQFADFLRKLRTTEPYRPFSSIEWQRHIVRHYADPLLEDIRRSVVRMYHDQDGVKELSPSEWDALEFWEKRLRDNTGPVEHQGISP